MMLRRHAADEIARADRETAGMLDLAHCSSASRASSPAGSGSASQWDGRSSAIRRFSSSTSRCQPRRAAAHRDAHRDPRAASAAWRDVDLCHARSGRGDDDGRPDGGDERRPHRADRRAARRLRPAAHAVRRALHRRPVDQRLRRASSTTRRPRRVLTASGADARRAPADSRPASVSAAFRPEHVEIDAAARSPADRRRREPRPPDVCVRRDGRRPACACSSTARAGRAPATRSASPCGPATSTFSTRSPASAGVSRARDPAARVRGVVGWLNATFRHWSLLPAVLLFAVLTAYPVLNLLRMSVSTITFKGNTGLLVVHAAAQLGRAVHAIRRLVAAVVNTLIFVAVAVTVEMVLGLALALLVGGMIARQGADAHDHDRADPRAARRDRQHVQADVQLRLRPLQPDARARGHRAGELARLDVDGAVVGDPRRHLALGAVRVPDPVRRRRGAAARRARGGPRRRRDALAAVAPRDAAAC